MKGETVIDPGPANAFPSLTVSWDISRLKITSKEVLKALEEGTPSIVANEGKGDTLNIGVVLLRPDQVDVVARRVKEILSTSM